MTTGVRSKCLNCSGHGGGGYSHVKTYGDVLQFWVGFLQEILKHGSHFHEKSLTLGLIFKIFRGSQNEPWQIFKDLCLFVAKS